MVIVLNCVTLGAVDPCEGDKCISIRCSVLQVMDHVIFAFFAVEMVLKMLAMGVYGKKSYLQESWNRLDCFIVVAGAAEYLFVMENINLSAIRTIRVLRPLRAINRIPSLRLLVMLLLDTLPMLGNVLLICFFIFFIFGIAGVQLWAGVLRQRCFFPPQSLRQAESRPRDYYVDYVTTTALLPTNSSSSSLASYPTFMPSYYQPPIRDYVCSPSSSGLLQCSDILKYEHYDSMCLDLYGNESIEADECQAWAGNYSDCLPYGPNPARSTISFDNIGLAWVAIFQVISLEGWTEVMYLIQDAYSFWVWMYFVVLIVIGAYFAVNLCLVVIATQFSETKRRELAKMKQELRGTSASVSSALSGSSSFVSRKTASTGNQGSGDMYTQIVDLIIHWCRKGFKLLKRRLCKKSAARHQPSSRDNKSNAVQSNGTVVYNDLEMCSWCKKKVKQGLKAANVDEESSIENTGKCADGKLPNDNNSNKTGKKGDNVSISSESWGTPVSSPVEESVAFLSSENANNSESSHTPLAKQRSSASNDVFLSCGSSEDVNKPSKHWSDNRPSIASVVESSAEVKPVNGNAENIFLEEDPNPISLKIICRVCRQPLDRPFEGSCEGIADETKKPKSCFQRISTGIEKSRKWLRLVVEHTVTMWVIMGAIVINALSMGAEHHNQSQQLTDVIESMNLVFTFLFVLELVFKLYAYGFINYIRDGFNMLDFIIVVISITELFQGSGSGLSVLRTFRLVRIVKLIRFLPALQRQLFVMLKTIDNVATFFLLLSLFIFIFSVLGMSLFGCKFCPPSKFSKPKTISALNGTFNSSTPPSEPQIWLTPAQQDALAYFTCPRSNFDSLLWSLLTVFQVLTQEAWASVLKSGMHYTSQWAALYFVALVTFGNYVLFNLLVAILVEGFSTDDKEEGDTLSTNHMSFNQQPIENPGDDAPPAITVEDVDDPTAGPISFLPSNRQKQEPDKTAQRGGVLLLCITSGPKKCWATFKASFTKNILQHNFFVDRESYSLYLLSTDNALRKKLVWLVSHQRFDNAVLLIIIANCIAIATERPSIKPGSIERRALTIANYTFNLIFGFEALIKIMAYGFIVGKDTYLKSGWNILDFFLVSLSTTDMLMEISQAKTESTKILEIFRVMRLLRALRPLRVINRAPGLKIVVQTLMLSIKPIGNIVLICLTFFLIFGILGVQLFKGCFYKCVTLDKLEASSNILSIANSTSLPASFLSQQPPNNRDNMTSTIKTLTSTPALPSEVRAALVAEVLSHIRTKNECLDSGFQWVNENYNFDHIGNGLMTLFVFSTFDGWVKITRDGLDCVGVDQQPIHDHNPWRLIYFISFLLIVGFFILNMFVGVVVNNFQKVRKKIEAEIETKKMEIKARKMLDRLENKSETKKKVLGTSDDSFYWESYPHWRHNIYLFCTHKYFDLAVAGIIGINVLAMAMEFYLMPPELEKMVKALNYIFTVIFVLEAFAKLLAYGPRRYFRERWNQLDVLIVILSIVGIVLEDLDSSFIPINPTIVRVARVFRIARVFKLLKMAKGIRELLDTVSEALPQVGNLSLLFMLLFFIYASLGVELFGKFDCTYKVCEGLSRHANFHNFGIALLTLFRISTGDNWNGILKDTLRLIKDPESHCADEADGCFLVQVLSPFYFVSFVLVAQFVLINVVVAVLMRQLGDSHTRTEVDPDMIEAEIADKVEELEKIVDLNCPELVERLQRQIIAERDDAVSLVSTEYMLRQRKAGKSNSLEGESEVKLIGDKLHVSPSSRHKTARRRQLVRRKSGDVFSTTISAATLVKEKSASMKCLLIDKERSRHTVNVDTEVLQQVFKDLGEQLRPDTSPIAEVLQSGYKGSVEAVNVKQDLVFGEPRRSLQQEQPLLSGSCTAIDTDEAAKLLGALSVVGRAKDAVNIYVEKRRKELGIDSEPSMSPALAAERRHRRRSLFASVSKAEQDQLNEAGFGIGFSATPTVLEKETLKLSVDAPSDVTEKPEASQRHRTSTL